MRRNIRRGGVAIPGKPPQMINRPTVMPAANVSGVGIPIQETDDFYSIETKNAGSTAQNVILFDAGGGYQMATGQVSGADVSIEGRTAPYAFILNDVVHNASFVPVVKMSVVATGGQLAEQVALLQYDRPLMIYASSKGSEPRLLRTIYPSKGVNSQQYHFSLNTFEFNLLVDNRICIKFTQEPETKIVWSFYQSAEVGRKQ